MVEIDPKNFDIFMQSIEPSLNLSVVIDGEKPFDICLVFKAIKDFAPDQLARQIEPLHNLLTIRAKLSDLFNTLNIKLVNYLQQIVPHTSFGSAEKLADYLKPLVNPSL
jgi:type VI secretion system ImpB/VipA family protein